MTGAVLGGEEEGVGGTGPDSERGGGGTVAARIKLTFVLHATIVQR